MSKFKGKPGRHTPRKGAAPEPSQPGPLTPPKMDSSPLLPAPPAGNSRDTPRRRPAQLTGFRPAWHRWVAVALLLLALLIIGVNDAMRFTSIVLLPGGHSELYLLLGLVVGAFSGRFFGIFDREL